MTGSCATCETCASPFRPKRCNANRYCSRGCMPSKPREHTTTEVARIRALSDAGLSGAAIARIVSAEFGVAITRSAVDGIRRRNRIRPNGGQIYQTWTDELRGAARAADWTQFDALLLRMMPRVVGWRAAA